MICPKKLHNMIFTPFSDFRKRKKNILIFKRNVWYSYSIHIGSEPFHSFAFHLFSIFIILSSHSFMRSSLLYLFMFLAELSFPIPSTSSSVHFAFRFFISHFSPFSQSLSRFLQLNAAIFLVQYPNCICEASGVGSITLNFVGILSRFWML